MSGIYVSDIILLFLCDIRKLETLVHSDLPVGCPSNSRLLMSVFTVFYHVFLINQVTGCPLTLNQEAAELVCSIGWFGKTFLLESS